MTTVNAIIIIVGFVWLLFWLTMYIFNPFGWRFLRKGGSAQLQQPDDEESKVAVREKMSRQPLFITDGETPLIPDQTWQRIQSVFQDLRKEKYTASELLLLSNELQDLCGKMRSIPEVPKAWTLAIEESSIKLKLIVELPNYEMLVSNPTLGWMTYIRDMLNSTIEVTKSSIGGKPITQDRISKAIGDFGEKVRSVYNYAYTWQYLSNASAQGIREMMSIDNKATKSVLSAYPAEIVPGTVEESPEGSTIAVYNYGTGTIERQTWDQIVERAQSPKRPKWPYLELIHVKSAIIWDAENNVAYDWNAWTGSLSQVPKLDMLVDWTVEMTSRKKWRFETICVTSITGLPFAILLARRLGSNVIACDYLTKNFLPRDPQKDERIVTIDYIAQTGSTIRDRVKRINARGAVHIGSIVIALNNMLMDPAEKVGYLDSLIKDGKLLYFYETSQLLQLWKAGQKTRGSGVDSRAIKK